MEPLRYTRRNRSPRNVAVVILWLAGLGALGLFFGAAWWLLGLLAVPVLPLVWDIWADTAAGLELDDAGLHWFSGRRQGTVGLSEIQRLRFDTRWDFSVRVTLILTGDKRVRLPQEATPPHRAFEAALQARGLDVERHHFTVF
ncbi:hypothetical protein ACFORG_17540 [Lutimaribacter marinistellae]|uniref:PH domain-containing protein n=1 Tax=Lutimaribacter marinistellae TaxID=1820329 RepID=A0ABV7TMZ4_9RHOB